MASFELLSDRLRLRPFSVRDAEGFYRMNAHPEVIRYTGDPPFESVAAAAEFIAAYDHYEQYGYGRWTIERVSDGAYLGFCGLKYHPESQEVDLGYRLARAHWGSGYATEAAQRCVDYAFAGLKLARLIGRVNQQNKASVRVLEKIGMERMGAIEFEGNQGWQYELLARRLF